MVLSSKNKIFEQVAKELGVVYKLYTPPYHPASNGRIEGISCFLKSMHIKTYITHRGKIPFSVSK